MDLAFLSQKFDEISFSNFIENAFDDFEIKDTRYRDDKLGDEDKKHIENYRYVGEAFLDDNSEIGVLILTSKSKNIENKRVAFSKIISKLSRGYEKEIILVAIYHKDNPVWRLTFTSFDFEAGKQIQKTDKKRYTYELGEDIAIKTAQSQIGRLLSSDKKSQSTLEDIFSVERVTNAFFKAYKTLYFEMLDYLRPQLALFKDEKGLELFSKKLLGRITFLYFLQKKGWLGAEKNWEDGEKKFLSNIFTNYTSETMALASSKGEAEATHPNTKDDFYTQILQEIFFNALNSKREDDYFPLLDCKMPFLNGGLFAKDEFDKRDIIIENTVFENIITIFDQYNFTIIEDTPHESEVAVDPEMLGRIFEDLLSNRKDKGAFYTPREIVHYMCQESIKNYLQTKPSQEEDLDYIKKIKVLDPAIGSGAFPMGMLHEIIETRLLLGDKTELSKMKKEIIEQSIYGIDIEPSAVEIAKLRFWLSIVVDEEIPTPLPNLFYKIMVGNSLLETINGFDPLEKDNDTLFGTEDTLIDDIQALLARFYRTHEHKKALQEEIDHKIDAILNKKLDQHQDELTSQLNNMDIFGFDNKKTQTIQKLHADISLTQAVKQRPTTELFFYKIYFSEVMNEGGFNIIIGNPPYIMEKENKNAFDRLHDLPCYQGKTDIWHIFTCKGIELLKENGLLSFIAKNHWLTSASASNMRKSIYLNTELKNIVDFGSNLMFENADIQTMILFLKKTKKNKTHHIDYYKFPNMKIEDIKYKLIKKDISFSKKIIVKNYNDKENLTFSKYEKNLDKIDSKKNFLFDEKKEIIQGIIGAPDKAFIIKENEVNNFTYDEQKYLKMIHTNTQKYHTPNSNKYIFYISKKNFDDKKIEDFSNIKIFFEAYKDELIQKKINYKTPTKQYFYLHRERDENFFKEGEKIIFTSRTQGKTFTYTKKSFYGTRNLFFIKSSRVNLKYMTALLNSQLMYFYMKERLKHTGDLLQIDKNQFMKIPLFVPNDTKPFEILVDYVMLLKTWDTPINEYVPNSHIILQFEEVLDAMVYELYFKEEFEAKLIQFEKEKGYIKFIEYAKKDYASIEGLDELKSIEVIHKSYQTLSEPYNKIRNNLILIDIEFSELIKPIKGEF